MHIKYKQMNYLDLPAGRKGCGVQPRHQYDAGIRGTRGPFTLPETNMLKHLKMDGCWKMIRFLLGPKMIQNAHFFRGLFLLAGFVSGKLICHWKSQILRNKEHQHVAKKNQGNAVSLLKIQVISTTWQKSGWLHATCYHLSPEAENVMKQYWYISYKVGPY